MMIVLESADTVTPLDCGVVSLNVVVAPDSVVSIESTVPGVIGGEVVTSGHTTPAMLSLVHS